MVGNWDRVCSVHGFEQGNACILITCTTDIIFKWIFFLPRFVTDHFKQQGIEIMGFIYSIILNETFPTLSISHSMFAAKGYVSSPNISAATS